MPLLKSLGEKWEFIQEPYGTYTVNLMMGLNVLRLLSVSTLCWNTLWENFRCMDLRANTITTTKEELGPELGRALVSALALPRSHPPAQKTGPRFAPAPLKAIWRHALLHLLVHIFHDFQDRKLDFWKYFRMCSEALIFKVNAFSCWFSWHVYFRALFQHKTKLGSYEVSL